MSDLETLRKEIDTIDEELLTLIQKRISIVQQIGELKKDLAIPIMDTGREKIILDHLITNAKTKNIAPEMIEKIWKTIFAASYRIEE